MNRYFILLLILGFASCQQLIDAPVPDLKWDAFDAPNAKPLTASERKSLEGIYAIGKADDDFGNEAVLKWSYVANEKDTTYYISFFCAEDVRYFICQGKRTDSAILLNGYWRNVENTKTGKAHFTIKQPTETPSINEQNASLVINGTYGMDDDFPEKPLSFQYLRPLKDSGNYQIIAHRGGGRNNDLLPASENSVEMILLAAQLGANGIEIDLQLTKDSVIVLYHDANINDRLTNKAGIRGPIEDYSYPELQKEITLKRGGKLPTLQQALETVLYKTPLEFVWLDCKYKEVIEKAHELQKEFTAKAAGMGRKLEIVLGLPDEEVVNRFTRLPNYKDIPSLCELDTLKAIQINAKIWAPSWSKGHQDEEVKAMHTRGKKAYAWTIDVPDKIKEFMYEANFDGMVTNRPTMAAYYFYARQ